MKDTRVLLVDDTPAMRMIVRDMLEEIGFVEIEEAIDGQSALEVIRSTKIALVVSDFNMEPRNGLELLRELKLDPMLSGIPFVMVTSESDQELGDKARQLGAQAFLKKPIVFSAFKERIQSILAQ